jgi:hypothetical protein
MTSSASDPTTVPLMQDEPQVAAHLQLDLREVSPRPAGDRVGDRAVISRR